MADLITSTYQGATITIGITGLPITVTGEVLANTTGSNIVTLKLKDGKIVNFAESLIAFFF